MWRTRALIDAGYQRVEAGDFAANKASLLQRQ